MKLEYLASGSKDCPLIRLYAFDQPAVLHLRSLIGALEAGTIVSSPLHKQPWIRSVENCELELCLAKRDQGVIQVGPSRFECILTNDGWRDIAFLLEPFCGTESPSGIQWLNERGKVSLLLSSSGMW
jgi:hypothetical protein